MSGARQSETLVRVGTVRRICTDVSGDRCRRSVVRVSLTMSAIRPLAPKLGHPVSLIQSLQGDGLQWQRNVRDLPCLCRQRLA